MRLGACLAALFDYWIMKKNVIIAAAVAAVCAGALIAWVIISGISPQNPTAEIYLDGKLYKALPLSQDCELVIQTERGSNTVTVVNGTVAVTEADCPDKVCVRTGAVSGGGVPIVCLPNRLEIRVVSGGDAVDTVM